MIRVRVSRFHAPLAALCLAFLFWAGCARPVAVESEPGPVYTLEVINPSTHAMTVSYETGGTPATLGTVPASSTRRFVVRQPGVLDIVVIGTEEETGQVVRREVALRPGAVASVRLGT